MYPALDVPRDNDLGGGNTQRPRNLLDHGESESVLDERAAAERRVCFQEQTVLLRPLRICVADVISKCYAYLGTRTYLQEIGLGVPIAKLDLVHRRLVLERVRSEIPKARDVEASPE